MAKRLLVNVNGTLKNVKRILVNVDGILKNVKSGLVNINGILKQFFSLSVTPVIEQQVQLTKSSSVNADYHNSTYPVTLTGRKYHFANADVFSYRFYRSADQVVWTAMTSVTFTSNPSTGSSSTVSYQLQNTDFTSTTMYFKFEYTANNSTFGTVGVSTSNIVSVMYLDIPAPPPGFPNINQSTIQAPSTASSGTWIGNPTLYDWKWQYGPSNLTLTYLANKSITYASISGTTATITAFDHGFKSGDTVSVSGINGLYNASNFTISSVFTNLFSYPIVKTGWSFLFQYSVNDYVSYSGNIYRATIATPNRTIWSFSINYAAGQYVDYNNQLYQANLATPSPRTTWNNSTNYTVGQYVNYGGQVWQSTSNLSGQTPFNGSDFWNLIDIYPGGSYWTLVNIYPGGSYWELQSGTISPSGGIASGPNYYEGYYSSPVSYTISSFPDTDYKTGTSLLGLTTRLNVAAYNAAFNGSANSTSRIIYGYPSFFFGAQTITGTTASIIYAEANMSVYDIDVRTGGVSISGYPKTNQANSSPISITGLSPGVTYTVLVTPKNADSPRVSGVQKTTSFTTPNPPGTPTITFSSINTSGFTVSWSASAATSYNVDIKNTSSGLSIGSGSGFPAGTSYPKTGTTVTSDTLTGLQPGTNYTVYVTGVNSSGSGPQANNNQYTNVVLSYNGNNNTSGSAPSQGEFTYNATATVQGNTGSLARTYATWAGWTLSSDGSGTVYGPGFTNTIQMNQSRTLFAKWNANIPGTPSINSVNYSTAAHSVSSNSLVFSGVNFGSDTQSVLIEWGTTTSYSSGSSAVSTNGGSYTTPASLSENTTYFWRARGYNPFYNGYGSPVTGSVYIPTYQYPIFYNSNTSDSVSGMPSTQQKIHNVNLTLSGNFPGRTGHTFNNPNGWNTSPNGTGTGYSPSGTYSVNASATLYAQWTPISYTIQYFGNGNTGGTAPATQTYTYGQPAISISGQGTLTRTGFNFVKWNTQPNGNGTDYFPGTAFSSNFNLILYAIWAPAFVTPACVAPSLNTQRLTASQFIRWYCDYPTPTGSVSSITGMQFEIRTTAGGGTLLASNTRAYPGAGVYPYNVGGVGWAFKAGVDGQVSDIVYSSAARYLRARVVMLGTDGNTYNGTYTNWVVVPA